MNSLNSIELSAREQVNVEFIPRVKEVNDDIKFYVILAYSVFILFSSFLFNSPYEILSGLWRVVIHPSILVSDYIAIGNAGSAFFNSGILMVLSVLIARFYKVHMNGTVIAAVFTVGGFAFFGKNVYNIWPILIGVFLYSKFKKDRFDKYLLVALFGTALAPLVSQIGFGIGFPIATGIILGNVLGIAAGFMLPPLANHVIIFHQGYNIYNVGFTAGILGTVMMSVLRSFALENEPSLIVAQGFTSILSVYLAFIFLSMIAAGYIFNNAGFSGYDRLLSKSGRLVTDYVTTDGFGLSLINMGMLGLVSILFIVLIKGEINGPIMGGIFTIVGFGAFGKHLRNTIPIMIGVYLASLIKVWDITDTGALLAALFGTTLAPIAGEFGWKAGIFAGFVHISVVMNVGYLHGGMNLYNNGFSGGIVAAVLVPIIIALRRE